jgi:hypothetical protein
MLAGMDEPRARPLLVWLRFALAVAGAFYVLMTLSLVVHEVLGHGGPQVAAGARRLELSVSPGFAGWARGYHQPTPGWRTVIVWGGIGANALVGAAALGVCLWRRPALTPGGLALYWVATTELGQALGYLLMGLAFDQGDAEDLPLGTGARLVVGGLVFAVFLAFARWSLRTMVGFVVTHFRPADLPALRRTFFLGFGLPLCALVVLAPGLPGRPLWTVVAFNAAVIAVLVAGTFWLSRRMPEEETAGRPIPWAESAAWTAAAVATFALTYLWLDAGVVVELG